ncbi:MAG: hypothetical protein CME26_16350 [Gemmatimonadetes bacterium]|nr:hypothetical protein [Gemmatimonadota bacterium]|tara:strand:- start:11234 stop:11422 length:189 start_codon:yes stop_codon:yes gene_type:complete
MISKFFGALMIVAAAVVGFSVLMMLVGTVIGLLWFVAKAAVVVGLAYLGYRLMFGRPESMSY